MDTAKENFKQTINKDHLLNGLTKYLVFDRKPNSVLIHVV